jgi:hypothetical protein
MHGKGSGNIRGEGGGRESVHPVSCVPLAEHFIKVTFSTHSPQFVQPETNPLTRAGGVCRHGKGSGSVEAEGWGSWGWRVGVGWGGLRAGWGWGGVYLASCVPGTCPAL